MTKCFSADGCDRSIHARGLCQFHYNQKRLHGPLQEAGPKRARKGCRTNGCDKPSKAHGLCSNHYEQLRRSQGRASKRKKIRRLPHLPNGEINFSIVEELQNLHDFHVSVFMNLTGVRGEQNCDDVVTILRLRAGQVCETVPHAKRFMWYSLKKCAEWGLNGLPIEVMLEDRARSLPMFRSRTGTHGMIDKIANALCCLSEDDREVAEMLMAGKMYRIIAEHLNMTIPSVGKSKRRIGRSLANLVW